jgi:hypothetical protein
MRKRSKYRPREKLTDPVAYVVRGCRPLADQVETKRNLLAKNHAAMDELVHGRGNGEHAAVVINALNITEALTRVRPEFGADWLAEVNQALDAMYVMANRGNATGRFVFTALELAAVNLAMEIHDQQLEVCSIIEMERALRDVEKVIASGRARKIGRQLVVDREVEHG